MNLRHIVNNRQINVDRPQTSNKVYKITKQKQYFKIDLLKDLDFSNTAG